MFLTTGLAEFLIGPRNARTEVLLELFVKRLQERGFSGKPVYLESAGSIGVILGKADDYYIPKMCADFQFSEDQWPEALGFRITCESDSIVVEGDHFSLRPLYWTSSAAGDYVGSLLQWVGAAVDAELDLLHATEFALVTFNLDHHTPLSNVKRMKPGQSWMKKGSDQGRTREKSVGIATCGPVIQDCTGAESRDLLAGVADRIETLMRDDCCIELSGGMDSRCVLALGNWRDAKPKFAFTIGRDADEDVRLARQLCKVSGVEHLRVEPDFELCNIGQDTRDYLESASYQVNATSLCWMPALFRELEKQRASQICGQMASTAFFYTPFDRLTASDQILKAWVDKRLVMSGNRVSEVFGSEICAAGTEHVRRTAMGLIKGVAGGFRDASDEFFLFQRNRQWATVVAHASRYWYKGLVPLLDHRVAEWAWRCRGRDKRFRVNQMRLCEDFGGPIAGVPFEGGYKCPKTRWHRLQMESKVLAKLAGGVRRRITQQRRRPDLNADATARAILFSDDLRSEMLKTLESLGVTDPGRVLAEVTSNVGEFEREIGFLVTLSLLRENVLGIAARVRGHLACDGGRFGARWELRKKA